MSTSPQRIIPLLILKSIETSAGAQYALDQCLCYSTLFFQQQTGHFLLYGQTKIQMEVGLVTKPTFLQVKHFSMNNYNRTNKGQFSDIIVNQYIIFIVVQRKVLR